MKLLVVLSLVLLAGYVQTSYSCCRKDDQSHRCTLREKIGIIRAALRQASCNKAPACPLTAENICDCHKEPVCPTKPLDCAPVPPVKVPACPTTSPCKTIPACPTIPPCPSNPVQPCSCQDKTPVCPLIPNKPSGCQQASVCPITQKPCVEKPVCPTVPGKSCVCQQVPVYPVTQKPCVDKAPLCFPIPVKVPQCQEKTPVCSTHVEKPCDCHVKPPVCPTHVPKPCDCHVNPPVCPTHVPKPCDCHVKPPVCPTHVQKPCDCHVKPPVCPAVTEKSCAPCQTFTDKKPCHNPEPCSHHMVIPIANVSNIFANSMFLGIPCKPHSSHCDKHTTTTTTTTTCAPPEPTCYVCVPCKGKQCTEVINKIKLYVTGGKEPCMVCDD